MVYETPDNVDVDGYFKYSCHTVSNNTQMFNGHAMLCDCDLRLIRILLRFQYELYDFNTTYMFLN